MTEDKRKYIRFGCLLPAEIEDVEEGTPLINEARIDDFSREGVRLKLSLNTKPGSTVMLNVRHPNSGETVRIQAEIVWSKQAEGAVDVGLKIKDMDAAKKSEILDCLYEEWRTEERKKHFPSEE